MEIDLKVEGLPIEDIFNWITYSDFGSGLKQRCFFSSIDKTMALHYYDDRGLDVVASNKELLQHLYEDYNSLILDHDRQKVDEFFCGTEITK